jgi:hypothetical protein
MAHHVSLLNSWARSVNLQLDGAVNEVDREIVCAMSFVLLITAATI